VVTKEQPLQKEGTRQQISEHYAVEEAAKLLNKFWI
jgi:hypothetical protein